MDKLTQVLQDYKNNPFISSEMYNDTSKKASNYVKDGLFKHHVSFYYVEGEYCYYRDYFGRGWNKRKIDKNGFIKYQTSMMFNPKTKALISRYDYFNG